MVTRSFIISVAIAATLMLPASNARADSSNSLSSPYVLQQALASKDHVSIYTGGSKAGLNVAGSFFEGRASGIDPVANNYVNDGIQNDFSDRTAELEGDQRVYALLVDGNYDFDYDLGTGLPLHPYMTGGMGMAMYGPNGPSASSLSMQSGDMVPLFRVGGGVTYRLGQQWNLSLDYKAGFSGGGGSDQIFTGRNSQPVDLQVLNMGMHYQF